MKKAIRVPLESLLILHKECRKQRCGDELSEKAKERITKSYEMFYQKEKGKILMDGDFGGAVGNPKNSYEEGRWTSWSVEEMKKILDKHNSPYKEEKEEERIYISI